MSDDFDEDRHFRQDAIIGSFLLRNAIFVALGLYRPAREAPPKPVKARPRPTKRRRRAKVDPSIIRIQTVVSDYFSIDRNWMTGKSRLRPLARPRQVAMFLARETGASFPVIARHFQRDHTTVLHACRVVPANDGLAADISALRARLAG